MTPTYAICISAPLCIIAFFVGLIQLKRTRGRLDPIKGTLPGGGSIVIGASDQGPDIDSMAQRIAEALKGELHQCTQVEALRGMASRLDSTAALTQSLGEDAVASGKNGKIKKGLEGMLETAGRLDAIKNEKLFAAGAAGGA